MPILTEKQRLETVNSFLSSLGYQENEKIYFRLIATTKRYPMKRILPYPLTELPEQYPPFNAYFVVNGQGNEAKEISHWKAIFCEFDDISVEKQKTLYKDLGLPEPTIMVYTGGKSVHCYWAFQEPISKEDGSILQSDLIEFMGADESNKDISRLFRVPCFKYVDKETHSFNGKTSEIISHSGIKYHYSDLRLAIPFTGKSTNNEVKSILKDFESEGKEYLAYELIKLLPPHKKGSGTYDYYRRFIGAFKNCFPEHLDELIAKLEIESDDGYQWQQIADSTQPFKHNLGTCFYVLDYLGVSYSKKALNALKTSMKMLDDNKPKTDAWLNIATKELFEGRWISLNNVLYKFNGEYYEEQEAVNIRRTITEWCASYTDADGKKTKATPICVENVFKWVNQLFGISPKQVNCEGLPLKNGYLALTIGKDNKPSFELKGYSSDVYFTYQSDVIYNPKANKSSAIKLLECLDNPYKKLFVKSLSTILGFKEIRLKHDRIKALLLIGDGSNGKDTLREIITLILGGKGMTNCSLNDFAQDRGFNLARLATMPKLNFSSENKEIRIDSIQPLRQCITGDPVYVEGKGKDGIEITLSCLFIFSTNHKPDLKGNQYAIQSRLTLIPFTKTYSTSPKLGQLKADPKFKHDKEFLIEEVAPAFLNLLIESFSDVYKNGINYEESEEYFMEVIKENNHLRVFADDIGLEYTGDVQDGLTVGGLYDLLLEWYFHNGYCDFLDSGKGKKTVWYEDSRKDPPVKLSKNLAERILEIYPKVIAQKGRHKSFLGLKIVSPRGTQASPTTDELIKVDDQVTWTDPVDRTAQTGVVLAIMKDAFSISKTAERGGGTQKVIIAKRYVSKRT